jgi:tyrosine-protein kinase
MNEFSSASDVWSFGVTLWEMFTLGSNPYLGQVYGYEFIRALTSGFRLPLPEFATYAMYCLFNEDILWFTLEFYF